MYTLDNVQNLSEKIHKLKETLEQTIGELVGDYPSSPKTTSSEIPSGLFGEINERLSMLIETVEVMNERLISFRATTGLNKDAGPKPSMLAGAYLPAGKGNF